MEIGENSSEEKLPTQGRIERSEGSTVAERNLAKLCQRNFLSLWSYPGVYRDQGQKNGGDGKEICDLLVVFEDDIIVFSDKDCVLAQSGDIQRDWQRWFRKAIWKSAEQAWGAERWIRQHSDRIFIDRRCRQRLPVPLPSPDRAKFHLIVVAHGVSAHIEATFRGSGSMFIDTALKGLSAHSVPFSCGDLDEGKTFVHVFDDDSLHTIMGARDTISDFVSYLSARERLLRGSTIISATGEEQLLAIYLRNLNDQRQHDFVFPFEDGQRPDAIFVDETHWDAFQKEPARVAQLRADRISYAWDKLIEKFSFYALRDEQYFVTAGGLTDAERGLRFMAREPRWKRRYLARALLEMLETTPVDKRRLRVLPPAEEGDPHYVFLLLPTLHAESEEEYRDVRRNYLEACCVVTKLKNPSAKDIIGIATETGIGRGRSEDCIYFDAREWTPEMEAEAREVQDRLQILTKAVHIGRHLQEYPTAPDASGNIKNPRNKPCTCGSGKKFKHCCGKLG